MMTSAETVFTEDHIRAVLADLAEENVLACSGLLSVASVQFTTAAETLAVTLGESTPRLLINPHFVSGHLHSETDLRSVLLHEFLHVLLGHTRFFTSCSPLLNLALDAVINHFVQRELGVCHGQFFRRFYKPTGNACPLWLLRPDAPGDIAPEPPGHPQAGSGINVPLQASIHRIRRKLGCGEALADDILDLLRDAGIPAPAGVCYLGNHEPQEVHPDNRDRLDRTFQQLNGSGLFRREGCLSRFQRSASEAEFTGHTPERRWKEITARMLRRLLTPHPMGPPRPDPSQPALLPIPSAGDRRAFLRSLWNPLIPEYQWESSRRQQGSRTRIYLDVSGSMNLELQALTGLLWKLRNFLHLPFHAFSDGVAPATFQNGNLVTTTSGGTCFNAVLSHILATSPGKALIITDGYVETPDHSLVRQLRAARQSVHVLLSHRSSPELIAAAGFPYATLPPLPLRRPS
ncbi:MAG: hypothetical protein RLZZ179_2950 [Verrucomicrobiota bacterium]|jgi:hypothetical protein